LQSNNHGLQSILGLQKCPKQTPFPLSNQLQLAPSTHLFEIDVVVVDAIVVKHYVSFCVYVEASLCNWLVYKLTSKLDSNKLVSLWNYF
jgi:hypothetical protein